MAEGAQLKAMACTREPFAVQFDAQLDTMSTACAASPPSAQDVSSTAGTSARLTAVHAPVPASVSAGVSGETTRLYPIESQHQRARPPRQDDTGDAAPGRWTLSLVEREPGPPADEATIGLDPDAALLAAVGARDPDAVRTLVARKLPRLLALATRLLGDRMEAEDVAQEVFVRTWKQAPHWQTGVARVDTWLHRVALNLCYDRLRGRKETSLEDLDLPEPVQQTQRDGLHAGTGADDTPETRFDAASRQAQVRAALAQLPPRQREAMVLHYYQDMSNVDAAALMGVGVEALESLLARARRNLRTRLSASMDAGSGRPTGRASEEA